jgi:hypothetical protein
MTHSTKYYIAHGGQHVCTKTEVNSTESGLQDGLNHSENDPVSQQGSFSGISNLKKKMDEIDREWAAFKIEQSKLEE